MPRGSMSSVESRVDAGTKPSQVSERGRHTNTGTSSTRKLYDPAVFLYAFLFLIVTGCDVARARWLEMRRRAERDAVGE